MKARVKKILEKKDESSLEHEDPTKSTYALKLMRENESLKEKLAQIEASSQICFHGKNLPPSNQGSIVPTCHDTVRTAVEQSHANFQNQQCQKLKSVVSTYAYLHTFLVVFFKTLSSQSKYPCHFSKSFR